MTRRCLTRAARRSGRVVARERALKRTRRQDDEPLRCVSMNSIRSTKVIDDSACCSIKARASLREPARSRMLGARAQRHVHLQVQSGARHVRSAATDSITVLESSGPRFQLRPRPCSSRSRGGGRELRRRAQYARSSRCPSSCRRTTSRPRPPPSRTAAATSEKGPDRLRGPGPRVTSSTAERTRECRGA